MLSHGDTPPAKNLVSLCQRAILPDSNSLWISKYNFNIDAKGQGHTEFMSVCDTLVTYGDTLMSQT